jgi:hypothetical protein
MSHKKYAELFDYLSAPSLPTESEAAIVFGRKDVKVANALSDLVIPNLVTVAVITGGIGKDSGDIQDLGYRSEAEYLNDQLINDSLLRGYQLPRILVEPNARNGAENAKFSLGLLHGNDSLTPSVTTVSHATSARRLGEMVKHTAKSIAPVVQQVHIKPTRYEFNPKNPNDQQEAIAEMTRLIEWPTKGWLLTQEDLPQNLVDFALDKKKQ